MDLATRIRQGLAEGKAPEEIVSELTAAGLSRPSAERLVDRALREPPPTTSILTEDLSRPSPRGGRLAMIAGAFLASFGVAATAYSYLQADVGGRYTVFRGAVIGGLVIFGKGVHAWWRGSERTGFPFAGVATAAVLPLLLLMGSTVWSPPRQATGDESETATRAAAEQAERQAAATDRQRRAASHEAAGREAVRAIEMLQNGDPARRCEGARILGAQGHYEPMWMLEIAAKDDDPTARACAEAAIAQIKSKGR